MDSDLEIVVEAGFIYLPLLFDPSIEREFHLPRKTNTLVEVNGRHFVKTLSLQSLLENYEKIHPESYEQLRNTCLEKYCHSPDLGGVSIDGKLRAILFQIMPYFIRRKKGLERRRLSEKDILDLICEKVNIPVRYYEEANKLLDTDSLRVLLNNLERQGLTIDPLKDGLISARKFREWLHKALEVEILDREKGRLRQALEEREQFVKTQNKSIAILLCIAEKGSLEIDGFGFSRIFTEDYLIYKHTGEYALKDYYGRIYLFPDCRVAVSTIGSLRPLVIDHYKHPFLEGHDSGQEICMRDFSPPRVFNSANVIKALEEGINALLYGYSSRRRNGYHSLDRVTRNVLLGDHIMQENVDDPLIPRRSRVCIIDFDDYRVSRDHPKIASGQVAVTNEYTP